MPGGYRHSARDERYRIFALEINGLSNWRIAKELGWFRFTIDREVARNSCGRWFRMLSRCCVPFMTCRRAYHQESRAPPRRWSTCDLVCPAWFSRRIACLIEVSTGSARFGCPAASRLATDIVKTFERTWSYGKLCDAGAAPKQAILPSYEIAERRAVKINSYHVPPAKLILSGISVNL